jgi:hypothetical protein
MLVKFPSSHEVELNPKQASNQSLWSLNELQSQVRVTNVALDLATVEISCRVNDRLAKHVITIIRISTPE